MNVPGLDLDRLRDTTVIPGERRGRTVEVIERSSSKDERVQDGQFRLMPDGAEATVAEDSTWAVVAYVGPVAMAMPMSDSAGRSNGAVAPAPG